MRGRSRFGSHAHQNGHRLPAAQADRGMGDTHRDGIAAEQALVQDFDVGAFDEPQLDQPALEFGRGHARDDPPCGDGLYASTKPHGGDAKCYGWFAAH